jgi:regulatory protein
VRIRSELRQRGVDEATIEAAFEELMADWEDRIRAVWQKRFPRAADDFKAQAKQKSFLAYRGFTHEQIAGLFRNFID